MKTRRQQRELEKDEAKSVPMQIEGGQEDVAEPEPEEAMQLDEPEEQVAMEEDLDVLPDDVAANLRIETADGQPEERLDTILQKMAEQQYKFKVECAKKLKKDNADAEILKATLLQKIEELPEEFLATEPNNERLAQIRMPMTNMPSFVRGKTKEAPQRVVRILNKDTNEEQGKNGFQRCGQILFEGWEAMYEELMQRLEKIEKSTDQE